MGCEFGFCALELCKNVDLVHCKYSGHCSLSNIQLIYMAFSVLALFSLSVTIFIDCMFNT
jgi:hypothetical protein